MLGKMDWSHPSGLAHVREWTSEQFSPTAQLQTAPLAANPPPFAIHRAAAVGRPFQRRRPRSGSEMQIRRPSAFTSFSIRLLW